MARPSKNGVGYFPKDVNFYQDDKVRYIRGRFGAKGMYLLDFILCQIYGTCGYYLEWNNKTKILIADAAGCDCSPGFVQELVTSCLSQGLFDENRATVWGILTSAGIQRQYLRMVGRRDAVYLVEEYLLLDKSSKKDFPEGTLGRVIFKTVSDGKTPVSDGKTPVSDGFILKVKKSKVNIYGGDAHARVRDGENVENSVENSESSLHEKQEEEREDAQKKDLFSVFWEAYPKKENVNIARYAFNKVFPDADEIVIAEIVDDIEKRKNTDSWKKNGGFYVPAPARYLNERLWEDPIIEKETDTPKKKQTKKTSPNNPKRSKKAEEYETVLALNRALIENEMEEEGDKE